MGFGCGAAACHLHPHIGASGPDLLALIRQTRLPQPCWQPRSEKVALAFETVACAVDGEISALPNFPMGDVMHGPFGV